MGLNIEAKAFFSSHFDMQGGITLQRSRYKQPEQWSDNPEVAAEKKMFRTPDIYGYFTANWEITHSLKASLTGTGTGPMLVQHLAGSGTDVDLAVRTESFFDRVNLDVSAGVSNIFNSYQNDFDRGPLRDSGYMYGPMLPRCINFGVSLDI